MNDLVNSLLLAMNENERFRAALEIISKDSYLDEFQMEYRPTSAAMIAKSALAETGPAVKP